MEKLPKAEVNFYVCKLGKFIKSANELYPHDDEIRDT